MIFLYSSLVFALVLARLLVRRKAAGLEKVYSRVAREADEVFRRSSFKDGNSNRQDPYLAAKKQLQLGLLAQKRDRVESRYLAWQARADRVGRWADRARAWKGRKLPYAFGVLDVGLALALADFLGFGDRVNAHRLVELVATHFRG
jgi:hypothetical protein